MDMKKKLYKSGLKRVLQFLISGGQVTITWRYDQVMIIGNKNLFTVKMAGIRKKSIFS